MEFVLGGTAACMAGIFTNPLEVVKTRVQLQGELKARGMYSVHYKNVFHAFYTIAKADGIVGLQKGLVPALWYQLFMNGIRLGTYDCIEKLGITKTKNGDVSVPKSILAGAFAGSMGAFVGSPFYMIKTHLQAQSAPSVAVGHQHSHEGMTHAIRTIFRDFGFLGLWRGVSAAMVRVTCGSSVQLATFSKCKNLTENSGIVVKDSWLAALSASMMSGVMVVACMTPMDVVSTRMYNQPVDTKGKGLIYKGVLDCLTKIFKKEGIYGFYKGWSASLLRTGPHVVLNLTFWSELKKLERRLRSPPPPIPC